MDSEYYRKVFKYSSNNGDNKNLENNDLESSESTQKIFRFYGKVDFDSFDKFGLKQHNWKVRHALTNEQKEFLKTHSGYKDHKETVHYSGQQGHAIMHRNYQTDIHKLIIHPNELKNSEDTINAIKGMFELGLECVFYDENNLPEGLVQKIKKSKESKLIKKIESN
ncbi:MAG: hypothetical protein ACP5NZ_05165 [Nanobdellota archaeon]